MIGLFVKRTLRIVLLAICMGLNLEAMAQLPSDLRSEQVFIAPEQVTWHPGDTLRAEGMVTCLSNDDHKPYSRYVYVELISGSSNVVVRQKVACDDKGYFRAGIPTDSIATEGEYWLRAYTRLMRNFATGSFAYHPVTISREPRAVYGSLSEDVEPMCVVGVPGGVLTPDVPQKVYAVVMSADGLPLRARQVTLTNVAGDTIASALSSASGYAGFTIMPRVGDNYVVNVAWRGHTKEYPVPAVDPSGVKVQCRLGGSRLSYEISGNRSEVTDLYIYDRNNGISRIPMPPASGSLTLPAAPETVTLFLTDDSCRILAEASVTRVAVPDYGIEMPRLIGSGEEIDFGLTGMSRDTSTRMMARVIPVTDVRAIHADEALRFRADFNSELPFPTYVYDKDSSDAVADIAAWLSTARFSRFRLKDVVETPDSMIYRYMPEIVMELNGTAQRYQKYPVRKGTVVAYNGDNFSTYDVELTKSGRFSIPVDDFEDGCEFMLQYINTVGTPELVDLSLDNDSFPAVGMLPRRATGSTGHLRRSGFDIDAAGDMSHQLGEVVVKARAHSEQKTSTRSYYAVKMKDRETIERRAYRSLLDILRDMPMLRVRQDPDGNWSIQTTRSTATLGNATLKHYFDKKKNKWTYGMTEGRGSELALIVDGSRFDPEMFGLLLEMPADDIESVEQLAPYEALAYAAFAIDGAVLVTTRSAVKPGQRKSRGMICRPMGITVDAGERRKLIAPSEPGEYRLLVDVVGPDGIHSLEQAFTVAE